MVIKYIYHFIKDPVRTWPEIPVRCESKTTNQVIMFYSDWYELSEIVPVSTRLFGTD